MSYLQAMGIESWRLRESLNTASFSDDKQKMISGFYFSLQDSGANERVAFIAEAAKPSMREEEEALLHAMAKAMKLTAVGGFQDDVKACLSSPPSFVVVLGESLLCALSLTVSDQVVVTHTPAQLLANPALKRETWAVLQRVMAAL